MSRGKGRGEKEKKQGGEEGKRFRVRTNSMSEQFNGANNSIEETTSNARRISDFTHLQFLRDPTYKVLLKVIC